MRKIMSGLALLFVMGSTHAGTITVSTGDLGYNVITAGEYFETTLNTVSPAANVSATLGLKYGLPDGSDDPSLNIPVVFNQTFHAIIGDLFAAPYSGSGPTYWSTDIPAWHLRESNTIQIHAGGNDVVLGQVDLTYEPLSTVPVPATISLLMFGLFGMVLKKKRQ